MKILLAMHLPYIPALGGANKCNRLLVEGLANISHQVHAIVPITNETNASSSLSLHDLLAAHGVQAESLSGVEQFTFEGVIVHALHDPARVRSHLIEQIKSLDPDWILVSGEEWSQGLLEAALQVAPSRVIYLAHTVLFLPFGPQAFFPSQRRTELITQVAHIVSCGQFVHDYIQQWSGLKSTIFHYPAYGPGPYPYSGQFENQFVTLINPSKGKGLDILLELAKRLSCIQFACVPTWGTTEQDRTELKRLDNMTMIQPCEDIEHIFSKTRVLLLPSLWPEGFPLTSVEAMLRGIPVLGSNVGGIPEAKLGTEFVLPVNPIESFTEELDDRLLPIPHLPTQSREVTDQWTQALQRLLLNRKKYDQQSQIAREAALTFVGRLGVEPFEDLLGTLKSRPNPHPRTYQPSHQNDGPSQQSQKESDPSSQLGQLTPDQLAQLSQLLQHSKTKNPPSGE